MIEKGTFFETKNNTKQIFDKLLICQKTYDKIFA